MSGHTVSKVHSFPDPSGNVSLTPRQQAALAALLAGKSTTAAAKAAHVTPRTVYRWRTEDALFAATLKRERDAAFNESLAALRESSGSAIATAKALMRPSVRADVRARTALGLLKLALAANEAIDVEERIAALEARLP